MEDTEAAARAHVVVHGRVQGVWFRGSAVEEARVLGLTGWVRNRPDGTVEAVIEGPRRQVSRMVAWCYRGPRPAQVTGVDLEWHAATGEFPSFGVRR